MRPAMATMARGKFFSFRAESAQLEQGGENLQFCPKKGERQDLYRTIIPTPRLLGIVQINKKDFFNIGFMLRRTFSPFFFSLIKHDAPRRMPSWCESHACFFFFGCWADMSASCCLRFYCLNPKIKNNQNKKQKGEFFFLFQRVK